MDGLFFFFIFFSLSLCVYIYIYNPGMRSFDFHSLARACSSVLTEMDRPSVDRPLRYCLSVYINRNARLLRLLSLNAGHRHKADRETRSFRTVILGSTVPKRVRKRSSAGEQRYMYICIYIYMCIYIYVYTHYIINIG